MVQKSSRQVAETEARGAGPSAEAAAGAASTRRRWRCHGDGDGGRSFEPKQATTTEARTRHGQLRSRSGVVRSRGREETRNFAHRWVEEIEDGGASALLSTGSMYIRNCVVNITVNMSNDGCVRYQNKLLRRSKRRRDV